tara:strand:- start:473 stop:661 length:189 start_codon:yes stop_codon:yes gene_type:complete
MKKIYLFLLLLTSCSLNNNSTYWNETYDNKYDVIEYAKDYTFDEYEKILKQYSNNNKIPKLN